MYKYLAYLCVTLIVIFMVCSCSPDSSNQRAIAFRVIDSTAFHFEGLNTLGISDSLIYISSYFDNSIHCFSFDGAERFIFGRTGNGPGEFSLPGAIATEENTIAINDMTENQIELFDPKGNYLQTIRIDTDFLIIGFTSFFFCNNDLYYETIKIGSFDKDLTEKIVTYKMNDLKNIEILKTHELHSAKNNTSYPIKIYSTIFPYKNSYIEVVNDNELIIKSTGKRISILSIPKEKVGNDVKKYIEESGDYENSQIKFPIYYPRVLNVFEINNTLFVLTFAQSYQNLIDPAINSLYYYDSKQEIFIKIFLPEHMPVSNLELANNEMMVFVDRENKYVSLYEIEVMFE